VKAHVISSFVLCTRCTDCTIVYSSMNWLKWSIVEMTCKLILLTHPWSTRASLTVKLPLPDAAKTLGAMSLGLRSWAQVLCQKEVFAPSPIIILVDAAKRVSKSWRKVFLAQPMERLVLPIPAITNVHNQPNRNTLAKLFESSTPRPPRLTGRVTIGHLTLHLPR
jgi:hypothetical protein